MTEPSAPIELLVKVDRDGPATLGAQVEDQLRRAIRDGGLRAGARLPSTRDLARQLGVSRRVTIDAYAQLAAEGYLALRQGAQPRVAAVAPAEPAAGPAATAPPAPRHDFRPSRPDVSAFPRAAWGRCIREALAGMPDGELSYGDPLGVLELRSALADYLGRVRGVVAEPERVLVTNGYRQGLGLLCHALVAAGARRMAVEDPSIADQVPVATRAGLEVVGVPVDDRGIDVAGLAAAGADAVVLTPAHQSPTGVVLAPDRRSALVAWLRDTDALAIEDDYDAEYRYDRAAVGALQGLDPDRVVYAGTTSKVLAPALRMGWMVLPARLVAPVREEKLIADQGSARIDQHAFASFLARGDLDRHLRRMRAEYRGRRDALVSALAAELPEASVHGIAAGLHVTVRLPAGDDAEAVRLHAERRRVALHTMADFRTERPAEPVLLLGYGEIAAPAIPAGVRALATAVREARGQRASRYART